MYDVGYREIINIDISEVVITHMKERNSVQRPKMAYITMDLMQMDFEDSCFQVVLDKGTLDAIMTDESEKTVENVNRMFSEIGRVLQVGGRFVCISLAQEHILKKVVNYFSAEGWMVRVHKMAENEENMRERQFVMPVFVFVCTKFKQIPGSTMILEICIDEQDRPSRLESTSKLIAAVMERQHYALLRNKLKMRSHDSVSLNLCEKDTSKTRYTLHVVDCPSVKPSRTNIFAIFIVPQGRETKWLFASEEGRKQLAESAAFQRLIIVTLHRDQQYESLQAIQDELSQKVMELAPPDLPANVQVPFLSEGGDIGIRTVRHKGTSDTSGEYVIEDVKGEEGEFFRQLIFLSNSSLVQSEAKLMPSKVQSVPKKKRKDKKKTSTSDSVQIPSSQGLVIDKSYLCCEHHRAMVAGMAFLEHPTSLTEIPMSVLVVGLGGGSLPLFIHDYFQHAYLEIVDIDPFMLEVATQWFGFSQDDRMKVHICDGLDYIQRLTENDGIHYHVIMFDVDSKDLSVGMSCPPAPFVEKSFLQKVRCVLAPQGVFILNLVCRDAILKEKVVGVIKEVFPLVYLRDIEGEVNEIFFCTLSADPTIHRSGFQKQAQSLENKLRRPGIKWDSTYSLSKLLQEVKLA
ncbi:eEF1A lysine and N-terminal methyltransferase isoform X2 [Protopterus annectens]|nr:eEF1A lysine and N-terminal methyltransferase isoform X2 [Protopterus annectens]